MIKFAEEKHKSAIASIWNEAFGDNKEDVIIYLDTLLKYVLICEEGGEVCGMLAILPVCIGEKKGRYVYAVATLKRYRGKGISTALLDYAKEYIKAKGESFLVLVPQNDGLFEFYAKRGFETVCNIERKQALLSNVRKRGFLVEEISAEQYQVLRNKALAHSRFVEWGNDMLRFAGAMYSGEFCSVRENGEERGIAFSYVHDGTLHIKELLGDADSVIKALSAEYGVDEVKYCTAGNVGMPYAMIYPRVLETVYFQIALD